MRLPPTPDVLLLDAGNTLVFLDHETVSRVLEGQGEEVTAEAIRAAEGPALRQYAQWMRQGGSHTDLWDAYVADIVRRAGVPPDRARALVGPLRAEHGRFNLWRRVGDGVVRALVRMHEAGVRLGVVSNSEAIYAGDVPEVDVAGATGAGLGAVLVDPFDRYAGYDDAPRVRGVDELADAWAADQPA